MEEWRAEEEMPQRKVVVIGGGTGLSVLLRGLKEKPFDLSAIVTVADDGGSSGRLREEMSMPPPGDIRNVIVALADTEPLLANLFQYRFVSGGGLAGHSLGNLFIAAMKEITGDFVTAVKEISRVLAVRGQVLPSANQAIVLKAEMEDGTIVSGESQIPKMGKKIRRVFLEPKDVQPLDDAIQAIQEADLILLGPGSLYTSILPNLLVPGISKAIKESKARKAYICNVMTQPGETDFYTASDHANALYNHVGADLFDTILVNNAAIPEAILERYREKGATPVQYDRERLLKFGFQIIEDNFVMYETYLRHDAHKLAEIIATLMEQK
ncbi:YvcK family protein [Ammoniphilus sp. CFH 90114]|uniref:gluconeogenesis factor YvcK family protein n=1 Tax=Ammoniphilus sp. CFH 90114 TaxID=2493665 RepID=UPI00100E38E9|nr:YvcK family protein [Ammoniphilus sp. CFH 90114]RXT04036.1 YvcK family protein [Ammoniphilus sp. CFH 90114]